MPQGQSSIIELISRLRSGDRDEQTIARTIRALEGSLAQLPPKPTSPTVAEAYRTNLFRSQERLEHALRVLEFHLDNSPVAVTEWGPDFRWIRWSAGAQRMFGFEPSDMLGQTFYDRPFIYPDDIPMIQEHVERLLRGEFTRFTATNRNIRKDGTVIWCQWHNSALFDRAGKIISVLSHTIDITDRVSAERDLRHARESLEAHLNNSPMAIVEWGPDNRFLRWSAGAERAFGYATAEMVGRRFDTMDPPFIHPEDMSEAMAHVQTLVSGESSRASVTARNHRKDGTVRWIEWHSSSLYDSAGKMVSVLSHGIDVTDRVLGEQLVTESEQRFRAAFELGSVGMAQIDARTMRFLTVNQEFCRITGYDEHELTHMTPVDLIHPDDRAAGADNRARLAGGQPLQMSAERRAVRKNGQVVWVHFAVNTLTDSTGKPERVLGAVIDITDRMRAEQQLRWAKERAEAASRAKDRFIATLSHELRTPLTPVRALLSEIVKDQTLPEESRRDLQLVLANVQSECRLIDELLDSTRLARGQVEVKLEPCDLHAVLRQSVQTANVEAEAKGLRLQANLRASRAVVMADPQRLQQVFWNLLGNALKFTPAGGSVEVVSENPSRDAVCVRVTDNGVGIAAEHLSIIFEPFERGETRHRYEYTGLGLGLSIARSLLELMHGSIDAHSDGPGKGATFLVTMPAVDAPAGSDGTPRPAASDAAATATDAAATAAPREPRSTGRRPTEPPRARHEPSVLIVEDHLPTAQILARLLRRGGRRVAVAATAAEARRIVAEPPGFDLLLCDIGLPDESGHDLLRGLRRAGVNVPAIALSGYGMDRDISASRAAGFVEHLVKPIDFQALEAAIARAVSGASA